MASSAVCTNYEMVARAFDMGWGGVFYKTICMEDIHEVSPRFVQVCTAVMQYGYRIIDDLILGLKRYMVKCGVTHLQQLVGEMLPLFENPSHLDRGTIVYPKFIQDMCIGCGRCEISCSDGGHQAIVFDRETRRPRLVGTKCVGCHLCRLVCPTGAIGFSKRIEKKS